MGPDKLNGLAAELHLRALSAKRGISDSDSYLRRVEKYYDHLTPSFLEVFDLTYQLGVHSTDERLNSLFFGQRAGVKDGQCVLDAGCGWGGPAIHLAEEYRDLSLVGVTVSEQQRHVMSQELQKRGLQRRVSAVKADFHSLPFPPETFDLVYFLESAGHSEQAVSLFAEILRVLKPGGRLYIKEPFLKTDQHDEFRDIQVRAMETIFQYKMSTLEEHARWVREAGFSDVQTEDITALLNFDHFWAAMRDPEGKLTRFGAEHRFPLTPLELLMGEIRAVKPS